ncbi:acyl-CoA dehydrogenase [Parasphingopyxis marina]|uniref:Acyl-CoA dehydrogenase family protein n=1 Tax=Parasphingopyxis marina TaxID=2761622 RepID=A0A842I3I8_9SPHN|nr:acyl-CoA dehydrogenase [Parasphingopyxis marina]MBC2778980.1 acyl-CoA dehydrogenase family protein [Parasphingopyxis marina]
MNDRRTILTETVDRLFANLAEVGAREDGGKEFDGHWQSIEAIGLPLLMIPEEAGGFGGDWEDAGVVFRALGAHGLGLPLGETVLARAWLGRIGHKAPEGVGLFAFAKEGPDESATTLNDLPWTDRADWILLLRPDRWSLLDAAGAETRERNLLSGDPRASLVFHALDPIADGPLSEGTAMFFAEAALLRACQIAGAIETMLILAIDHVRERRQFGRPLARFQAIQHQLAILAEENAAASCAAASACQSATLGEAGFEIAAAKWRASRAADIAADIAHQVHGAIGFTREYALHAFTLRARAWGRDFGNETYWARTVGRIALAERPKPLWHWLTDRSDRLLETERKRNE